APRRPPALEPLAVEHVEGRAERALGLLVVREPPGRPQAAAIRVDVLDADALVEPVLRARTAEARVLHASPRRLPGRERVAEVVDPDHARVDAAHDAARLVEIARPDARRQPEPRVVRTLHGLVLAVERLDAHGRAEDLVVGQRAPADERLEEPAVARTALGAREALDAVALRLRDERPQLERARSLGEALDEVVVERTLDVDALGADARLACVEERGEHRAVDRALEVRICEDDHRVLAAELEHDGATARAGGGRDAPSDCDGAREEDLRD